MSDSFLFMDRYLVKVDIQHPQVNDDVTSQHIADKKTTFVFLNGLGVPRQKYSKFIIGLAKQGYTIISADYPCCGENQPKLDRSVNYGYQELVQYFVPPLLQIAQKISKDNAIYLMGHSLGGQIATFYSALHGVPMIGVAAGNVYHKNWQGTEQLHILKTMLVFKALISIYGYLPAHLLKIGDRESKKLIQNWCQMALTGRYHFIEQGLNTSKGNGMYVCIKGDQFAPQKATQHLAKLCDKASFTNVALPKSLKGNPHGVWVKEPEGVIAAIDEYLNN